MKHAILAAVVMMFVMARATAGNVPNNAIAQREYARAEQAFQSGDLTRASQLYTEILERDAAQPFAWFRLGLAHHQLKNFRQALQAYDNALRHAEEAIEPTGLKETVAKTHFNRALLLLDQVAEDMQRIPADGLDGEFESRRIAVHEYVRAALQSASSRKQLDPIKNSGSRPRARSYVYTAPSNSADGDATP